MSSVTFEFLWQGVHHRDLPLVLGEDLGILLLVAHQEGQEKDLLDLLT